MLQTRLHRLFQRFDLLPRQCKTARLLVTASTCSASGSKPSSSSRVNAWRQLPRVRIHGRHASIAIDTCSIGSLQSPHTSVSVQSEHARPLAGACSTYNRDCCNDPGCTPVRARIINVYAHLLGGARPPPPSSAAIHGQEGLFRSIRVADQLKQEPSRHRVEGRRFPSPIRRPQRRLDAAGLFGERLSYRFPYRCAAVCAGRTIFRPAPARALLTSSQFDAAATSEVVPTPSPDPCRLMETSRAPLPRALSPHVKPSPCVP